MGTTLWGMSEYEDTGHKHYSEVKITSVLRGEEAAKLVLNADAGNQELFVEGQEPMVIVWEAVDQYTDPTMGTTYTTEGFEVVSSAGEVYERPFFSGFSPYKFDDDEALVFGLMVDIGDEPLLCWAKNIWFSLTPSE